MSVCNADPNEQLAQPKRRVPHLLDPDTPGGPLFFVHSLKAAGLNADTPEAAKQLIATTGDAIIRKNVLSALVELAKEEAIPTLKTALADPSPEIRIYAAELLSEFGDSSAISEIRAMFAQELAKPHRLDHGAAKPEQEERAGLHTSRALKLALALARLGDYRGFEVAVNSQFEHVDPVDAMDSDHILSTMAESAPEKLREEHVDPFFVLLAAAESDNDFHFYIWLDTTACHLAAAGDTRMRDLMAARNDAPPLWDTETLKQAAKAPTYAPYIEVELRKNREWEQRRASMILTVAPERIYFGFVKQGETSIRKAEIHSTKPVDNLSVSGAEGIPGIEVSTAPSQQGFTITVSWKPSEGVQDVRIPLHLVGRKENHIVDEKMLYCYGLIAREKPAEATSAPPAPTESLQKPAAAVGTSPAQ